ncbi:MAG: ethanolamine ammonia-lyase reactivating factor EutA [Eubacterium aggregans]|uniref:ethanolamine ammonia-lyase reactivating factor EutA n=1 Tax=Eubacterium aggregans TaxID=81409 RepID=UPI002B210D4C|nr:ethanolamine ammonia-lyase reactivating factor EutA [Eubacterium aggregans]MEA5073312.1 ethanolamine ammonia-lyase reactivating factor EutA [Eubacterium aggregans]
MKEVIKSVGIDIGTSTTQLVFSQLTIENLASSFTVPRISIVDKTVFYRSQIYFTPLKAEDEIDAGAVKTLILQEYAAAGISPGDLKTGAVIITGDTARKKNADAVLQALSEMAGDFVVATAGPDLESVLSARGAGTDVLSQEHHNCVANIDIGGGTSNIAVFDKGKLVGTACLDIGGRLVRVEGGRISGIYHKLKAPALEHGLPLEMGQNADIAVLRQLCRLMADHLAEALGLLPREADHGRLYTNNGQPLPEGLIIDALTLSGGVADCMGQEKCDEFCYGDIGVLLGEAIEGHPAFQKVERYPARETIRATVVGAGSHTMNVSGSTIHYVEAVLPMKNIPILKLSHEEEATIPGLILGIKRRLPLFIQEDGPSPVAIALSASAYESFQDIQALARGILEGCAAIIQWEIPLVLILECDIGKVLGNAVDSILGGKKDIICLDGVYAQDGDYIDIGKPVAGGRVCPVVIKTMVFNT